MPATFNNQTPPYPQKENSIIGLKNFNVYCKTGLLQGVKFFTPSSQNYAYKFACNENAGDLTNNHSYFAKTSWTPVPDTYPAPVFHLQPHAFECKSGKLSKDLDYKE